MTVLAALLFFGFVCPPAKIFKPDRVSVPNEGLILTVRSKASS